MKLSDFLLSCGMTEKEIDIYLALLTLGESSAQQIADHTNRERTSTLRLLQSMVSRGRLGQTKHFHTSHFFAVPLTTLKHTFDQQLAQLMALDTCYGSIQEEYDQLTQLANHDTSVKLYEGLSGLRTMYQHIIRTTQEQGLIHIKCLYTATLEALSARQPEYESSYEGFLHQLAVQGVTIHSVAGKGIALIEELVAGYTHDQIDAMPRGAGGIQLWIVGQSLWFVITKREAQLIHITSRPLANFFHVLVEQKTVK